MHSHLADIEPRMMEALELAKSLGASAASVAYSHNDSRSVSFESNRLKGAGAAERQSYAVNVVVKRRRGTAIGNMPEALPEAVRRAVAFAAHGAAAHFDEYLPPADEYAEVKSYSGEVMELGTERMVADCQRIIDPLLQADGSLVAEAAAAVQEGECLVANTGGFCRGVKSTLWNCGGGFQKTTGTDMLFSGSGRSGCRIDRFYDSTEIVEDMLFDLGHSRKTAKAEGGVVTLVIPPMAIGAFLSPLAMAVNGRNVYKGTSPLRDSLHEKCFAGNVSILDDPHIDYMPTSSPFDNDGIPTSRRMVVENGVLNCFLYDYDTACMAGAEPTGNDYCSPWTMLLSPGDKPSQELIRSVENGIYVKELLGFGQTNMANGDFSANLALGFLIRGGEIVGRVKDAMIAGNIFQLLKGDVEFSSDVHPYFMQPFAILPGVGLRC